MIGKTVGHERIGPNISGGATSFGNADGLLPDRSRVGDFENFGLGIKEFVQIGKINMSAHPVGPEIVDAKQRRQINFSGNAFADADAERFCPGVRDWGD